MVNLQNASLRKQQPSTENSLIPLLHLQTDFYLFSSVVLVEKRSFFSRKGQYALEPTLSPSPLKNLEL